MNGIVAKAVEIPGGSPEDAVRRAALEIREALGRPASIAFAFIDPGVLPALPDFVETLRVDGHIRNVVGCTAGGRIFGSAEIESGGGCSILALACDVGEPIAIDEEEFVPSAARTAGANAWVMLSNPREFPADSWLKEWNAAFPGRPCVGGMASGTGSEQEDLAVFLNDRIVQAVGVPITGSTTILPVISQGCRPIGEPLTVTRADHNVVYALGGQPAYHALESAFESLSDTEKSNARGNLFAGIAGTEYVDEFKPGDFLIRNIIGADPNSGAVVIADIPRIGQTLQYQLRDRTVAGEDLSRAINAVPLAGRRPFAALLFSCLGRGEKFFGETGYDARHLSACIGGKPLAGFFCNGEIAPVAGINALHGYSAAGAIWVETSL